MTDRGWGRASGRGELPVEDDLIITENFPTACRQRRPSKGKEEERIEREDCVKEEAKCSRESRGSRPPLLRCWGQIDASLLSHLQVNPPPSLPGRQQVPDLADPGAVGEPEGRGRTS